MYPPIIENAETIRPTQIFVDLKVIEENFHAIQRFVGPTTKLMPILKANAYGHGLKEVGILLDSLGVSYLGVAYLEEGILLRNAGVKCPILILGGIIGHQIPQFLQYNLTLTASSISKLEQIERAAQETGIQARVHLKVDTGMERIGVHYYNVEEFLKAASSSNFSVIEGIFSHLADAENSDTAFSMLQIERFEGVIQKAEKFGLRFQWTHLANSATLTRFPQAGYNMVRPGISLYGVRPANDFNPIPGLRPALEWKSKVVYFKVVQPDQTVSYGRTWSSPTMTRVVTIPVGYGDGYMRSLSNEAKVIIRGKKYPVVGKICMDQMMVNLGWDSAYNEDTVILIGSEGEQSIRVEDVAEWAGTIPYEILTNINTRVPRIYVNSKGSMVVK